MRKPIGLTAPYRPKTVLAPNAPWPERVESKPKPKRVPPKPNHSKRRQVDANFDSWLNKVEKIKC